MSPAGRLRLFADTTPLRTPVRTPDFWRLWLAGIVTVIGGNLTIFAVPVQLYALTQNSAYVGLSGIGPRLADAVHGAGAAMVGTTRTAAGGGVLVIIGVALASVAVPAFVRYRVGPAKTGGSPRPRD
jgi:hypothetical protein